MKQEDPGSGWRVTAVFLVLAILVATLRPGNISSELWIHACLLCGMYGLADVLRNLLLFMPLGLVLPRAMRSVRNALIAMVVLTVGIEVAQLAIPGRDSSPSDVLFNTLGGLLGIGLGQSLRVWLPPGVRPRPRYVLGYAAALILAFLGVGIGSGPVQPDEVLIGQWAPERERYATFTGLVHSVAVGERTLPSWPIPDGPALYTDFLDGESLGRGFARGDITRAPQLLTRVVMPGGRELLLLGTQGNDVVVRVRTGFTKVRLYEPMTVVGDVLTPFATGDAVSMSVFRAQDRFCIRVSDETVPACASGMTAGRWWALGVDTHGWTIPQFAAMIVLGLVVLGAPLGWWGGLKLGLLGALSVMGGVVAVGATTALDVVAWEALPLLAGVALGWALRQLWNSLPALALAGTDLESTPATSSLGN